MAIPNRHHALALVSAGAVLSLLLVSAVLAQAENDPLADPANHHAAGSGSINSTNAQELKRLLDIPTSGPVTGAPALDNNHAYFADWSGNAYALDLNTGQIAWTTHLEQPQPGWPWQGFTAPASFGNGTLYLASAEGTLFAIDPATGNVKWQTRVSDQQFASVLAKPLYSGGMVYVGLSSVVEPLSEAAGKPAGDFRGHVIAYHADTGQVAWDLPLANAPEDGVAVSGGFALDPATNTLFFGTGNNYTQASRFSDSVLAVNATTGELKWAHQVRANDVYLPVPGNHGQGLGFDAAPNLFSAGGKDLLGIGSKDGNYYAFDRSTGGAAWQASIGNGATGGGIRWDAAVSSSAPTNGRIFISSNESFQGQKPADHAINVAALDPATGHIVWSDGKTQPAKGWSSGLLLNDVYFEGSLDGTIQAYRVPDGKVVATLYAPGPVGSSFTSNGDMLFAGIGVPAQFGGKDLPHGLVVYSVNVKGRALPPDGTATPAAASH